MATTQKQIQERIDWYRLQIEGLNKSNNRMSRKLIETSLAEIAKLKKKLLQSALDATFDGCASQHDLELLERLRGFILDKTLSESDRIAALRKYDRVMGMEKDTYTALELCQATDELVNI